MNSFTLVLIAVSFILGGILIFEDFVHREVLVIEVLLYSSVITALLWKKLNFNAALPMIIFLVVVLLLLYWRNSKSTGLNINIIDIYYFICIAIFLYYLKPLYSTGWLLAPLIIVVIGFTVLMHYKKPTNENKVPYLVFAIPLLQIYLIMLLTRF